VARIIQQQLWGYKVEQKMNLGGKRTKEVEYHCFRQRNATQRSTNQNWPNVCMAKSTIYVGQKPSLYRLNKTTHTGHAIFPYVSGTSSDQSTQLRYLSHMDSYYRSPLQIEKFVLFVCAIQDVSKQALQL
jgi:hypothetical protein